VNEQYVVDELRRMGTLTVTMSPHAVWLLAGVLDVSASVEDQLSDTTIFHTLRELFRGHLSPPLLAAIDHVVESVRRCEDRREVRRRLHAAALQAIEHSN